MKNNQFLKTIILFAVFVLAITAFFGLFGAEKAQAGECICGRSGSGYAKESVFYNDKYPLEASDKEKCYEICQKEKINDGFSNMAVPNPHIKFDGIEYWNNGGQGIKPTSEIKNHDKHYRAGSSKAVENNTSVCANLPSGISNLGNYLLKCPLLHILSFVVVLLSIAGVIFDAIINPTVLSTIINNEAIYFAWSLVRDFLNIVFIFVLLYSAFCTVFQVDKYHWSKVVPNLILMALLVNFSYPITRFIIDVANVIMYFFINQLSPTGTLANIADASEMEKIITTPNPDVMFIIASIVFTFILAMTFIVLALLLLVRVVTLAILIIFSPIAFVGPTLPGSELSGKAGEWWKKLMDAAFFGPIMLFFVFISLQIIGEMAGIQNQFSSLAEDNTKISSLQRLIGSAAYFSIPVIILWMGMMVAKKSSLIGASAIVGSVTKHGKSFAKNLGGIRPLASWGFKKTGIPGGMKQRFAQFKKSGWLGSERAEEREAKLAARMGVKGAQDKLNAKKVKEAYDDNDMSNKMASDLKTLATSSDKYTRAAAIKELADKHGIIEDTDFEDFRRTFGEASQEFKQLAYKVRSIRPELAFANFKSDGTIDTDPTTGDINFNTKHMEDFVKSSQFRLDNYKSDTYKNAAFMEIVAKEDAANIDDIVKLKKKGASFKNNLEISLNKLASNSTYNVPGDSTSKFVQRAYTATTGKLSASIDPSLEKYIYEKGNKDTLSDFDISTVSTFHKESFARNISIGKFKEMVSNMDNTKARNIVRYIYNSAPGTDPNVQSLKKTIDRDPQLRAYK